MTVMRILSGLVGMAWILFGVFLFCQDGHGFWHRVAVPIGFVGTGWYFLGFAITGRRGIAWYSNRSRKRDDRL